MYDILQLVVHTVIKQMFATVLYEINSSVATTIVLLIVCLISCPIYYILYVV